MDELTIRTPDDLHVHLRDDVMLPETVPATARCFARATVMPNLVPPVTTADLATAYKQRILAAVPAGQNFDPLMTLYLTMQTSVADVEAAKVAGIRAIKLYPAGATTNSDAGVSSLEPLYPIFEAMSKAGILLLIHGEVTEYEVDVFDREKEFIERYLRDICKSFPDLKIVLEHITTKDAAEFVGSGPENIAASITPQHLLLNRNDLLAGTLKPHNFCLPILKRNIHQLALREAVASGSTKFFLGTDSAPHARHRKEAACGCAGCYSAWSAIELYAQVFDDLNCLDKLEAFASENGADFYGLARNEGTITLRKESWTIPEEVTLADSTPIVPFFAGQDLRWKLA